MVIHGSTADWRTAQSLAAEDDFEAAATAAARSAQQRLERFGIESTANCDLAVGELLYAIHYARRAGEDATAVHLRGTLEAYARMLQRAAYERLQDSWPETTHACLVGLFEEWIGDAYLFTGSSTAGRYYDRAEPWYRVEEGRAAASVSEHLPCWGWGGEPQFERAMTAFYDHLDWVGLRTADSSAMNPLEYDSAFFERLAAKRDRLETVADS